MMVNWRNVGINAAVLTLIGVGLGGIGYMLYSIDKRVVEEKKKKENAKIETCKEGGLHVTIEKIEKQGYRYKDRHIEVTAELEDSQVSIPEDSCNYMTLSARLNEDGRTIIASGADKLCSYNHEKAAKTAALKARLASLKGKKISVSGKLDGGDLRIFIISDGRDVIYTSESECNGFVPEQNKTIKGYIREVSSAGESSSVRFTTLPEQKDVLILFPDRKKDDFNGYRSNAILKMDVKSSNLSPSIYTGLGMHKTFIKKQTTR